MKDQFTLIPTLSGPGKISQETQTNGKQTAHRPENALTEFIAQNLSGLKNGIIPVKFTDELIPRIERGILFVAAGYSVQSQRAFSSITEALRVQIERGVKIFLIDGDNISSDQMRNIFKMPLEGRGETFWIVNGRIKHFEKGYDLTARTHLVDLTEKFLLK